MRRFARLDVGRHASRLVRQAGQIVAALSFGLFCGFLIFAQCVSLIPGDDLRVADGMVALTGGEERIAEAIKLLAEGKAKRLLISGVNPATRKIELITVNGSSHREASLFRCCVDLDKRALNTEDNAFETTAWVRSKGFRSLIVVTSSYHMPRSLIELRQAMPDVELIPYPVTPAFMEQNWWSSAKTARVLGKEYVKFVSALARYAANSVSAPPDRAVSRTRTINARLG